MLNEIPLDGTTLALIGVGAALVLLLTVELYRQRLTRRGESRRDEQIQALQADLRALCTGAVGISNHLVSLEQRLQRMAEQQERLDHRSGGDPSFGHAIKLAQRGADAEELMESCGLARGEAELLLRLHRMEARH